MPQKLKVGLRTVHTAATVATPHLLHSGETAVACIRRSLAMGCMPMSDISKHLSAVPLTRVAVFQSSVLMVLRASGVFELAEHQLSAVPARLQTTRRCILDALRHSRMYANSSTMSIVYTTLLWDLVVAHSDTQSAPVPQPTACCALPTAAFWKRSPHAARHFH